VHGEAEHRVRRYAVGRAWATDPSLFGPAIKNIGRASPPSSDTPKHAGATAPPLGVEAPLLTDEVIADMGAADLKRVCREMKLYQGGNKEAMRMRVENFIDHNHNKIYIQVVPSDRAYTPAEAIWPGFVDGIFDQMLVADINIPTPLLSIDYDTRPASDRGDFILRFIRGNCVPLEDDAGVTEGEVGRMHVNLTKFKRMLMREYGPKRPSIAGTAAANRALDASMRVGGTAATWTRRP